MTQAGLRRLTDLKPGPGCLLSLTAADGRQARLLLLTQAQARQLWKGRVWGAERLFLASDSLLFDQNTLHVQKATDTPVSADTAVPSGTAASAFAVYPDPGRLALSTGAAFVGRPEGIFTRYTLPLEPLHPQFEARRVQSAGPAPAVILGPAGVAQPPADKAYQHAEIWQVTFSPDALAGSSELLLRVNYIGDAARAYLGEALIDDDFYHGLPWEIGLSRFAPDILRAGLTLRFLPLRADAPIYLPPEARPDFAGQESFLQVRSITVHPVQEQTVVRL